MGMRRWIMETGGGFWVKIIIYKPSPRNMASSAWIAIFFSQVEIGGLVYIVPAHVCLAVNVLNAEFMIISENGD